VQAAGGVSTGLQAGDRVAHCAEPMRCFAFVALSSLLVTLACQPEATQPPAEPAPTTEQPGGGEPTPAPTEPVAVEAGRNYDLVVSFFSPGDGTDHAAEQRLAAAIAGVAGVVHARGHWGREGEHDECFVLGALSAEDRAAFIAKAKAAVEGSEKVNVSENAVCQDRGS
jgi:hypothetical protein